MAIFYHIPLVGGKETDQKMGSIFILPSPAPQPESLGSREPPKTQIPTHCPSPITTAPALSLTCSTGLCVLHCLGHSDLWAGESE